GQANTLLLEAAQQREIDPLQRIHVRAVVGHEHPVHDLVDEREFVHRLKVRPVEADIVDLLELRLDYAGNAGQLVVRRLVGDADGDHAAALAHAPVVADAALQQVAVGEDQLLPGHTAHARGLQPDALDFAAERAHLDRVATSIESPTTNGLSSTMDTETKMSDRISCTARATATLPMPRPAISDVICTPGRLSSTIKTTMDHSSVRSTKFSSP